jgi:hypothetical protein
MIWLLFEQLHSLFDNVYTVIFDQRFTNWLNPNTIGTSLVNNHYALMII